MSNELFLLLAAWMLLSAVVVNGLVAGNRKHPHVKFDDPCPNGAVAYDKYNEATGVFECAIKTAAICNALCLMTNYGRSMLWDVSNSVDVFDETERDGWYCRALIKFPAKPCYFKPKDQTLKDVAELNRSQKRFEGRRRRSIGEAAARSSS